ncbi:hypothetical protein DFH09DRAFT_834203, partial [Mycena vulgaris]
KPRRVEVVAEMVPVEAMIGDTETWSTVERESSLPVGSITGMRWIKAENRCNPGQRVAHLRVEFTTAEAANQAIDGNLYFGAKSVRVRKSEDEARRCAKCQKYDGHIARECPSEVDVCARCSEAHRTSECTVMDAVSFRCANCEKGGHGPASRECPAF